jgi:hypothetical protein
MLQRELLKKADLTFKSAVEIALSYELTVKTSEEFQDMSKHKEYTSVVNKIGRYVKGGNRNNINGPNQTSTPNSKFHGKSNANKYSYQNSMSGKTCSRCNGTNHNAGICRYKSYKCNTCNKIGHLSRACTNKVHSIRPSTEISHEYNVNAVPTESDYFNMYNVKSSNSLPYTININIENSEICMEIDTGAGVSVIPEYLYCQHFANIALQQTKKVLRTYSNEQLDIKGAIIVDVKHNKQCKRLELIVIEGRGPALIGRDWLKQLKIEWSKVCAINSIKDSLNKYESVFDGKLGLVKNFNVKLPIKKDVTPKFMKARPVPYALKPAVDKAIDNSVKNGTMFPVQQSNWATPIVCILKKDKSVRICGDYRITANPALEKCDYPLPNPSDIFAELAGGVKFSTLDLSMAYQQLQLDKDSRELLTINTHRGLFAFTRLVYGLSISPFIFQRVMDNVLKGLPNCVCYLDDILITGKDEKEHLSNLEAVLERLQSIGLKLIKAKCNFFKIQFSILVTLLIKTGFTRLKVNWMLL